MKQYSVTIPIHVTLIADNEADARNHVAALIEGISIDTFTDVAFDNGDSWSILNAKDIKLTVEGEL